MCCRIVQAVYCVNPCINFYLLMVSSTRFRQTFIAMFCGRRKADIVDKTQMTRATASVSTIDMATMSVSEVGSPPM